MMKESEGETMNAREYERMKNRDGKRMNEEEVDKMRKRVGDVIKDRGRRKGNIRG